MELLGIRLVGLNAATGHKILPTIGLVLVLWLVRSAATALLGKVDASGDRASRVAFWSRQGVSLLVAVMALIGVVSIWFDNPANLTTAVGLVTAGLAFALQKVVTALAGYFVILRGSTFTVGDRIVMGGVRGDVVALGFFQTTIVTVSNARIFDEAVFNYTREFPFIWEEMHLPIAYRDDPHQAEQILLAAAKKHAVDPDRLDPKMIARVERDYRVRREDFAPAAYWRLTDNWLEITVRFIAHDHGVRRMKDEMSREVLAGLDAAGIGIASTTYEITGLPTVQAKLIQ